MTYESVISMMTPSAPRTKAKRKPTLEPWEGSSAPPTPILREFTNPQISVTWAHIED
ncbi:MAG: hypothetical protein J07HQX50_00031 [Haloquadratum sp. J07HQX50]|nr:MAG: hypothetical protein J07HQX50_00031 [Haloquadratum sp. J07HQX50]